VSNRLILYSTNTWLAYNVAERYFGQRHYVWCTPFFDSIGYSNMDYTIAPTSCPKEIYLGLHKEVSGGDRHSTKIEENKLGIMKGAALKKDAGIISEEQEAEIASIIATAERRDFRPLLYIIPYQKVSRIKRDVPVNDKAHPLSVEYVIESLPRNHFDVIEWE
jgi:hypothetical protein